MRRSLFVIYIVSMSCLSICVFSCKQKTAYVLRISDWSSDVCSSDLPRHPTIPKHHLDRAGAGDHMMVGQHIAIAADDHARSQRALQPPSRLPNRGGRAL